MFNGILGIVETLLVLSLTFVVLATAASSVAGIFLRFTRSRARGYRNMIEYLYRNEVVPSVAELVQAARDAHGSAIPAPDLSALDRFYIANHDGYNDARLQFVADIAMVPVPVNPASDRDPRLDLVQEQNEGASIWIRWKALGSVLSGATVMDFRTRFRASQVGKSLLAHQDKWAAGDARAFEKLLDRMAFQFETHASGASDWFKGISRRWSIPVGFILAFGLNIDTIDVYKTYMQSPTARSEILKKQDQFLSGEAVSAKDNEKQEKTDKSFADLERKLAQLKADASGLQEGAEKTKLTTLAADVGQTLTAARNAAAETTQIVQSLQGSFPIGWERYPGCLLPKTDRRCSGKLKESRWVRGQWLIGLLITGLLMGLGAPFWVEMTNNMLRSRKLVMSFKGMIPGGKTK